ncbi:TPA: SH3 domain-containing protein [Streptococcus suis]|nr:SH3 domain-containing protein [Streptococcus suis]HEM3717896.1 SH3 domain-containing protein [Streptococcus suis]
MKLFHFSETAQRFSLRKYAIGLASVCLAFTFLGSSVVAAEEVVSTDVSPTVTENGSSLNDSLSTEVGIEPSETQLKEQVGVTPVEESTVDGYLTEEEKVEEAPITESKNEVTDSLDNQGIEIKTDDVKISSLDSNIQDLKPEVDGVTSSELEIKPEEVVVKTEIIESPSSQATVEKESTNTISSIVDNKVEELTVLTNKELESTVRSLSLEIATEGSSNLRSVREARMASRSATSSGIVGDDYPASWKYQIETADPWGYYMSYCTSFVAHRLSRVNKFETPRGLGDAKYWASNARSLGYRVDNIPAIGSVAYDISGLNGHVAWVADVSGDNVTIEEYNYANSYSYHQRTVSKNSFTGYIHFKDLSSSSSSQSSDSFPTSGTYRFTSRLGVKNEPKISSPDIAYYESGEVVNYDRTLTADNHQWISYISYSGNRRYIAVKQLSAPSKPSVTGDLKIQNKNSQAGTFDVVITNVSSNVELKAVQVPIWSDNNGQDDIVWYHATRQNNGEYRVAVNTSNHKNDNGLYHIHLYYLLNSGEQVGVGTTTTNVSSGVESRPPVPNSGSYTFTGRASVRNEARMASPEIAYYNAGSSVNYDKVLFSDGRYWISYVSFSGARRYINIT